MPRTLPSLPAITDPVVIEGETGIIVVKEDPMPTDGRRFWTEDIEWREDKFGQAEPNYKVSDVAKFFFGRGAEWLRWRSGKDRSDKEHPLGWFLLDGVPVEPSRTAAGARYYSLYDVERMALALWQENGIYARLLSTIVLLLRT